MELIEPKWRSYRFQPLHTEQSIIWMHHVGESIFLFGLAGLFMQGSLAESLDFPKCGERP